MTTTKSDKTRARLLKPEAVLFGLRGGCVFRFLSLCFVSRSMHPDTILRILELYFHHLLHIRTSLPLLSSLSLIKITLNLWVLSSKVGPGGSIVAVKKRFARTSRGDEERWLGRTVMAAKEAILELLKNCSFPNEVLTDKILACVRQHKLGIVPVARYAKEALNLESLDSETFGTTVESHVRAMVDMARRNDDTVCLPTTIFQELVDKIDDLYITVKKQSEQLVDLEVRLKNEMKLRESFLVERIEAAGCTCTLRGAWSDRDTNDIFVHCYLIFYFPDFKFSNFFCPSELHPLIWFFLKNSFRKKKNIQKTTKNALASSIFIVLAIVLKFGTPLLHIQAQNTLLQNF